MKVGYIRVSTTEQNTERQKAIMEGLGVEKLYTDMLSGKNTDRPQLNALLDFVREGDTVVVESYSRLARSTKDLLDLVEKLDQKKVQFISQKENIDTSTPQGRLMFTMFAGLAQFERECLLQRQREGIEIAKQQGKYKGRPKKSLDNFLELYASVKNKEISISKASKLLGVSRSTFYRKMKEHEDSSEIDFG
ncbi:recombinase family protein [Brassicibacter mesophilus]|uniref:recombinase family protein n=1 Tax=Brassicibacter mesophilus TaxID=745119 RepID=UPI003D1E7407